MFLVSYLSPAHMKVLGSKFRRYQVQTVTIIGYMISRKVRLVKAMVFLVVVYGCWEFNYKGSWVLKNWCFWTVLLEKTLESPLDFKEIQRVHPKGNQSWIFIGRTDAEAETPILWPLDVKNWLIGKNPDAGKDWRQKEERTTEDKMVGWHHRLEGHEFEQAPGFGDGQESLVCCSPWGCKVRHNWATELNWHDLRWFAQYFSLVFHQ